VTHSSLNTLCLFLFRATSRKEREKDDRIEKVEDEMREREGRDGKRKTKKESSEMLEALPVRGRGGGGCIRVPPFRELALFFNFAFSPWLVVRQGAVERSIF